MTFLGVFGRFSGIFCPWTSYRSHILTQEHNILKILSLGLYLDKLSIVFKNCDFWPFYVIFWAFFGYFLSVNELQWTFMAGDLCGRSCLPQTYRNITHLSHQRKWLKIALALKRWRWKSSLLGTWVGHLLEIRQQNGDISARKKRVDVSWLLAVQSYHVNA